MSETDIDIDTLIDNIIVKSNQNKLTDNSNQLILDDSDNEYIYQILINIFTKFIIRLDGVIYKMNSNKGVIESFNLKKIDIIKSYFRSMGFNLHIDIHFNLDEYDLLINENYQNRYCKISYRYNDLPEFNFLLSQNFRNKIQNNPEYNLPNNLYIFKGYYVNETITGLNNMFIINFSYLS